MLAGYEAVRFKKAQTALTGGSWTSLEKLEVLLHEGEDARKAQQAVDRSSAMAKGAIVTRFALPACLPSACIFQCLLCLSACLPAYLLLVSRLFVCLSVCLYVCMPACLLMLVYLSVRACLSVPPRCPSLGNSIGKTNIVNHKP